jgi:hypothetical protein
LIVITGGQRGDNETLPGGKALIEHIIKKAQKEKTVIIVAGIGENMRAVENEFP